MKLIQDLIPFLAPYPVWVKVLAVLWAFLSVTLICAVVLARPGGSPQKEETEKSESIFLTILAVEVSDRNRILVNASNRGALIEDKAETPIFIRLRIHVNDKSFRYPSFSKVIWMEIGSGMSQTTIKLESISLIESLRFDGAIRVHETIMDIASQESKPPPGLPAADDYLLYIVNDGFRSSSPAIRISYKIE